MVITGISHGRIICPWCGNNIQPEHTECSQCGAAVTVIRKPNKKAT